MRYHFRIDGKKVIVDLSSVTCPNPQNTRCLACVHGGDYSHTYVQGVKKVSFFVDGEQVTELPPGIDPRVLNEILKA